MPKGLGSGACPNTSVDDAEHARIAREKAADKKFSVLSDPGAKVIQAYGLLHAGGRRGDDVALRTTILIDKSGRAQWRRVSETVPDVPTVEEVLAAVRKLPSQ